MSEKMWMYWLLEPKDAMSFYPKAPLKFIVGVAFEDVLIVSLLFSIIVNQKD